MNLLIVSASHRTQSQSAKVASYISEITKGYEKIVHLELCQYQLPLWDGNQESKIANNSDWPMIEQHLQQADAVILITPEWGGMATPLLKNFLLMCSSQSTAHKPVLLVAISSGISGAYPIAELRMNSFKNNKLVAIPDHLIIRDVEEVLNNQTDDKSTLSKRDNHIRHRIGYSLHILNKYSQALKALRTALSTQSYENEEQFLYGM